MTIETLRGRLRLPLISAPMFLVSGKELVLAACRSGIIGSFPTANCRTVDELDSWLTAFETELPPDAAPFCPNLIIKRLDVKEQLACLLRHRTEMVITSVGSPAAVIPPLHDIGCSVFADVASLRHAEKAIAAGVDGLVLLTAGAGGQTGWVNGFAFVRAVRAIYDGPIVLAGGLGDGAALWAAEVLGCDLGYMGTRFIATRESMAVPNFKQMLVDSELDDVMMTTAMTGLETNLLRPSIVNAGLDPNDMPAGLRDAGSARLYEGSSDQMPTRWKDIWSAGHSVSSVKDVIEVSQLVDSIEKEYLQARSSTRAVLAR